MRMASRESREWPMEARRLRSSRMLRPASMRIRVFSVASSAAFPELPLARTQNFTIVVPPDPSAYTEAALEKWEKKFSRAGVGRRKRLPHQTNASRYILKVPYAVIGLGGTHGVLDCVGIPVYFPGAAPPEEAFDHTRGTDARGPAAGEFGDFHCVRLPCAGGCGSGDMADRGDADLRAGGGCTFLDRGTAVGAPIPRERGIVRRPRTGDERAVPDRAASDLHLAAGDSGEYAVSAHAVAVGGAFTGAVCGGDGDPGVHGRPTAGFAVRRTLHRISAERASVHSICAIVSCMTKRISALTLALVLAGGSSFGADLTEQYKSTADKLMDAALADTEGYSRLTYLCYRIGNRLSGSTGLEKAIAWSVEQMKAAGLSNVRVIPATVPHWVRGTESARMLAPLDKPLQMLKRGMSIGTPPGGITAAVVSAI